MSEPLTITRATHARVSVLHLVGALNAHSEDLLVEAAQAAHADNPDFLLLDLKDLEMIMSAGLRALQKIYKLYTPHDEPAAWEAAHAGKVYKSPHFKLAGAASQVHYVLSLSGFLQNIPIHPTVQAALDSFDS